MLRELCEHQRRSPLNPPSAERMLKGIQHWSPRTFAQDLFPPHKSHLCIFCCCSTSLHRLRMGGSGGRRRSVWGQTLLEIVYTHYQGCSDWRSNLTVNSTELLMYESVRAAAGCFLASPRASEWCSYVLCKCPGAWMFGTPTSTR